VTAQQDSPSNDAVEELEAKLEAEKPDDAGPVEESANKDEAKSKPAQRKPKVGGPPRRGGPRRGTIAAVALVGLVIASMALAAWLFYFQYRPSQQTDIAAADTVTKAASEGTVALLTYSPKTIDQDLTTAKSHLTGDFLTYYTKFTDQIVAPAAKQKEVQTTATVVKAAVSELHADSAVVLLFVNQTTVSKERPAPAASASSVRVTLTKVNGSWLISKFEPL
jgi:Mce-associated membrane protein